MFLLLSGIARVCSALYVQYVQIYTIIREKISLKLTIKVQCGILVLVEVRFEI